MADQDHDLWAEFDNLEPAGPDLVEGRPGGVSQGFGLRTGVRSAKVALGFAIYALALGTTTVLIGAIVFAGQGEWLLLGLLVLIEAVFVYGFRQLLRQVRNRRAGL
ncbi:hypothetical protein [Arthrobacter sp. CJ23]|uniref:hypothetical protein n=1 Tax=Arthrobacter sp. CJ23 TaxID=2972479 RepID=UPI00215CE71A|nr:hypothetical protein [Arthrobacter sp. CJ23]UVJ40574.1 hypothetical protein NVV90_05215 [Arthrobacter sp. CJ23]